MDRREVDHVGDPRVGLVPVAVVVVAGDRLRNLRADPADVAGHHRRIDLVEGPHDHVLVADADRQHDVVVHVGQRDGAVELGLVRTLVAALDIDAELDLQVDVVLADHLQRRLADLVVAVEEADQSEAPLHQQVEVLLDVGLGNHFGRKAGFVDCSPVGRVRHRLARRELCAQRAQRAGAVVGRGATAAAGHDEKGGDARECDGRQGAGAHRQGGKHALEVHGRDLELVRVQNTKTAPTPNQLPCLDTRESTFVKDEWLGIEIGARPLWS